MEVEKLAKKLKESLPFEANQDQVQALDGLAGFALDLEPRQAFLLQGHAGTGKTSLMKALVKTLPQFKRKVQLLAPTGRAAKVLGNYTQKPAQTIHKKIYTPKQVKGGLRFVLNENKATNTLFIVDEASMIGLGGQDKMFEGSSLLDDLIQYIYSGVNCKLLLVGDTAQLPPVGLQHSPAMDPLTLEGRYRLFLRHSYLKKVERQALDSGILANAVSLRYLQEEHKSPQPQFDLSTDVQRITQPYELEEALIQSYQNHGRDGSVVIVRSNKRANIYNQQIRSRILGYDNELSVGDQLMVVKNNYFWLPKDSKAGFIANGDIIEVTYLREIKEMFGFRFARVSVRMVDYPDEPELETVLLLDTLHLDSPALPYEKSNELYQEVSKYHAEEKNNYRRFLKVKNDPFFNALQVKFAYAVTCHKAQGGQWDTVFLEQSYLPDGAIDKDYLRWLYTAFTRAQNQVYLVGFAKQFFQGEMLD